MFEVWFYSLISVLIVSLVSLIGIFALRLESRKFKDKLLYLVSFAAGALFGDALIHLLPEAVEEYGFSLQISIYLILGIITFFIVEKFIHWRHCHIPYSKNHTHPFAIMNLIGDGIHNFIDGLIIASSYILSIPLGIATTLAVILHEIPQEIGDFSILIHGGFKRGKALFLNFLTATLSFLGVIVAILLSNLLTDINKFLIPFAAGGFIYIAGSDLIPELHKEVETKKSIIQLLAFILGIVIMISLLLLE